MMLAKVWTWVLDKALTVLGIGAIVLAWALERERGNRLKEQVRNVQNKVNDHVRARERERAGREAVQRGRDSGDTPDERVRRNDDAWK